jgi:uncharacterized protein YjbI with pentapeptide repeats
MDVPSYNAHGPKQRKRRALLKGEAEELLEDLRHGRVGIVDDVEFPSLFSVDVPRLRDVTFISSKLWLTIDPGWFGRASMSGCRFVDCELDALRVRKASLSSNTFERVVFGGTSMGGVHDASVDGMTLIDCRLRDHSFSNSTVTRLEVLGGSMADLNIMECDLESSVIQTDIDDVNLVRCSFAQTDMSGSVVGGVAVLDWRRADLRLPRSASGFLFVPEVARSALAPVLPKVSTELRARLDDLLDSTVCELLSERYFLNTLKATTVEADILVRALLEVAVSSLDEIHSTG